MRRRARVFLDASVLIAGILSSTGASRCILDLAHDQLITVCLTKEVVREVYESLMRKSDLLAVAEFYRVLAALRSSIGPAPSKQHLAVYNDLIDDPDDRHILAGAATYRADVLVTHDRRHFMTERLRSAGLSFAIQTPGQFLTDFRRTNEARP